MDGRLLTVKKTLRIEIGIAINRDLNHGRNNFFYRFSTFFIRLWCFQINIILAISAFSSKIYLILCIFFFKIVIYRFHINIMIIFCFVINKFFSLSILNLVENIIFFFFLFLQLSIWLFPLISHLFLLIFRLFLLD